MTILVRKVASKGWLKNTKRFKAISSFSPILSPSQVPWWIKAFAIDQPEDTNVSEFTIGPTIQPW